MMTRILLMLLSLGILSITNGCYFDPSPYNNSPSYRGEGQSDQRRSDDDQERRYSRRDRNQDARGDQSDQVSMIMVIRRGRIGLVGNGHREGWRRDVDLQLIENKVLSRGVPRKPACNLVETAQRKSQDTHHFQQASTKPGEFRNDKDIVLMHPFNEAAEFAVIELLSA